MNSPLQLNAIKILATSKNLNRPSLLQSTLNTQVDNIEKDFHAIFIGKYIFHRIS